MSIVKVVRETTVITGPVRLSYAHVWEPASIEGSDPKYSCSLLIPKDDTDTIKCIEQAVETAKELGKAKFGGKIPASLKLPLRDGDEERPDDPAYEGKVWVNASAKGAPGIVDRHRQPISDESEVYSGCWCHASITFYAFNTNGNKGIACGLNHLMKIKDDQVLAGRSRVEDDFDDEIVTEIAKEYPEDDAYDFMA